MSIASFISDTNTRNAYKTFCKDLYEMGITEDIIHQKKRQILEILRSGDRVVGSQSGGSNIGGQRQLRGTAGCFSTKPLLHTYSH